ncbi:TetR/AcrR family transcriptional regulator [Deinococcus malanensis]|uniref:TetR/AcrR family transcriptional regulator n=1 Tax=Deinococcus malanensis TaxID=1706855 RepID=UPI00363883D9
MTQPRNTAPSPPKRRDAQRNRQKILNAARCLFATHGANASLDAVACRAEVGSGTLYRHFPTRESLVAALLREEYQAFHSVLDQALAHEDGWDGLCHYLEQLCSTQISDQHLGVGLTLAVPGDREVEAVRASLREKMVDLLGRAQAQGSLRGDITPKTSR